MDKWEKGGKLKASLFPFVRENVLDFFAGFQVPEVLLFYSPVMDTTVI